jgi:hypothetical protein
MKKFMKEALDALEEQIRKEQHKRTKHKIMKELDRNFMYAIPIRKCLDIIRGIEL